LSYGFWQRRGGDRNIAGKTVELDGETRTVVGVMPKGFNFPAEAEMWFPMPANDLKGSSDHSLRVIGRLKAGAALAQAQAEMKTIAARLQRSNPKANAGIGANVVPLMEQTVGEARRALLVLMGAVACVLLIACANVANLLLVRATGRRRELALRLSLGASRWRVIRSLLTESVLLALAGGAFGVATAYALVSGFVALDPIHLPRIEEVAVNWQVMGYALAASLVTGIAFGMAPAWRVSRPDTGNWLKEGPGAPGAGEFGKNRGRGILAAVQIAMAVVLLVGGGLLLRSFVMRVRVPLGFQPEGVLGAELPWFVHRRVDDLLVRLRALPGVLEAGASTAFPQDHAGTTCGGCLEIEGQPEREGKKYDTGRMVATPEFFRAAGIMLRQGRLFTAADGADSPKVAVISEALARRDFPAQNPVGRHIRWGDKDWITIVGVAASAKGFGVAGDPMPVVYFPNRQADWNNLVHVLVRTAVPPASLAGVVRKEIRAFNSRILISRLDTVENMLAESVAVPRFYMMLVVGFAAIALLVSAVGVYGIINYSVARRTHEIGIRMALGAERGSVLAMVLRQGLTLTGWGVVVGLAGAWVSTRVLENLLFGVRPGDAVAFASAASLLVVTALLACYVPARRATRVDPLEALRHE
jgi:putative ABC transport system permease protein